MPRPFYRPAFRRAKPARTPGDRALAAWRGVDLFDEEQTRTNHLKTVSELMPGILKGLGLERKQSELEILKVWNNLLDPVVVAHAKPVGLAKGTLFVNVDSNVWLDEIVRYRDRKLEILKVWNNLLDPVVVAHAKPVGLAKGTLFVNVDSNVWLDEIVRY